MQTLIFRGDYRGSLSMNLLPATLGADDLLTLANDAAFGWPCGRIAGAAGQPVVLEVRPDRLSITEQSGGQIGGGVRLVAHPSDKTMLHVQLDIATAVTLKLDTDVSVRRGGHFHVTLDLSGACLFDCDRKDCCEKAISAGKLHALQPAMIKRKPSWDAPRQPADFDFKKMVPAPRWTHLPLYLRVLVQKLDQSRVKFIRVADIHSVRRARDYHKL